MDGRAELTQETSVGPELARDARAATEPNGPADNPSADSVSHEPSRVAGVALPVRGRIALSAAQVAVTAVLAALALAVTTWWVIRDDPGKPQMVTTTVAGTPLASPSGESSGPPHASGSPSGLTSPEAGAQTPGVTGSGATKPSELIVDVAGKVRRPGVVVLEPGDRVIDALDAAGGARPGVDLTSLNLARPLVDGEQILVGIPRSRGAQDAEVQPTPEGSQPGTGSSGQPGPATHQPSSAQSAMVNLNAASLAELETLPGVGPVTAQAIIDWRTTSGGFQSVDQLLDVDGIGEKTLERLAPYVTIG